MTKPDAEPGKPTLHFTARLRDVAFGGTADSQLLGRHPKVREKINSFIGADSATNMPNNPSNMTGLTRTEKVARRIRERCQDEVARGATMGSLAWWAQKTVEDSGPVEGTGVDLFRAADDAVGIATAAQGYASLSMDKARNGPLSDPLKVPWVTLANNLLDEIEAELTAVGLTAPGIWLGDSETQPEPWRLNSAAGGTWDANTAAEFAGTEILFMGAHRVGRQFEVDDGDMPIPETEPDMTLADWIADEVARNPGFAPISNQSWSSAANVAAGNTVGLARLRHDLKSSAYARLTADLAKSKPFFANMLVVNYEQSLFDNPRFPLTTFAGGGAGDADHITKYFGLDGSSPEHYPVRLADMPTRFSAVPRAGVGRGYDEAGYFARARRTMTSLMASSSPNHPKVPWIRGIDGLTDFNPRSTVADLVRMIRLMASYPGCLNIEIWTNEATGPNTTAMLEAVETVYPEWVRTGDGLDWEAA